MFRATVHWKDEKEEAHRVCDSKSDIKRNKLVRKKYNNEYD